MDNNIGNIKQQFMLELMVFSPKYNAAIAQDIVDKLTSEEMNSLYEKLSKINEAQAEELAELEDKDPEEYERRMQQREEEEQKSDDAYFNVLEKQMLADTDDEDQKVESIERQMDLLAEDAGKTIDREFDMAEELVNNLFEEVNASQPQAV